MFRASQSMELWSVIPCSDRHFFAYIAINAIINNNISYKISINYWAIKTQIVIILSKTLIIGLS